jgi:hypothetical protein
MRNKVTGPFKNFYNPRDIKDWVSLTLTIYVKGIYQKLTGSCDPIKSLERSLVLHPSRLNEMLRLEMLGLATYQTLDLSDQHVHGLNA